MGKHPYNTRGKTFERSDKEMSERSESANEEELDETAVPPDTELDQLRKKLETLQASLNASYKENNMLKKEIQTRANSAGAHQANANRANEDTTNMYATAAGPNATPLTGANERTASNQASIFSTATNTSKTVSSVLTYTSTNTIIAPSVPHCHVTAADVNTNLIAPANAYRSFESTGYRHGISNYVPIVTSNNVYNGQHSRECGTNFMGQNPPLGQTTPLYSTNTVPNSIRHPYLQTRKLIDLPEFHGSPEEWPMFSVAYRETTNTYGYTNLENLLRLQKALKGAARQRVQSLLIHPASVESVLNSLEFMYGRPELLIRSQIAKARAFPAIAAGKLNEIINLFSMVSDLTAFLESAGAHPYLANPTLMDELVSKLPLNKREEWVRHTFSIQQPYPSLRDFCSWLQQISMYISVANDMTCTKNVNINESAVHKNKTSKPVLTVYEDKQNCKMCQGNHKLNLCEKFKELDNTQRWNLVKQHQLCFSCLKAGHGTQNCTRRRECGINSCRKPHNRLLHNLKFKPFEKNNTAVDNTVVATIRGCKTASACKTVEAVKSENRNQNKTHDGRTLLKYLPVKLSGPKGTIEITAFIDEGSKLSLLEESTADLLGLKGATSMLCLRWIGDKTTRELSRNVCFEIGAASDGAENFFMKGVRTTKNLLLPQQSLDIATIAEKHKELECIPLKSYTRSTAQLLIGMCHTSLVRPTQMVNFEDGFTAHNTKLGWVLFGSDEPNCEEATVGHVATENDVLVDLQKQMSDYFELENLKPAPLPRVKSTADIRAENILAKTTKYLGGVYETGLLWKSDDVVFGESFSMAMKRLKIVEGRMAKDADFANWYNQKISEYVSKSYAVKLTKLDAVVVNDRTWYLPHFVVQKNDKRRLVFDAAAKKEGVSLNSMLMKGPDEYQPKSLLNILFKFRQGVIGVCGDIKEMFHRVDIRNEDRCAQRFLWREGDQTRAPDIYTMKAMIFGSICSPCSAQYIKNVNAEKFRDDHPRAVEGIINRHYVDDYVDSFATVDEAIEVTKQIKRIHSAANFELRRFVSNSEKLLNAVVDAPTTLDGPTIKNMLHGESNSEKILGMYWHAKNDEFYFQLKFSNIPTPVLTGERRPTKSEMLSLMMSIFDPYGFLCNVIVASKIMMQELWRRNTGWHEPVPDKIYEDWYKWYADLSKIKEFRAPRCYQPCFTLPDSKIDLHIFVDASEMAFAAVAYWRIQYKNEARLKFVFGKSRCSPIKPLSIPRLELQAAVLGVRVKEMIVSSHDIQPERVVFWSDSKTVIQWLHSDARRYKQYVSNRISEILQSTTTEQWRFVPGKLNPADEGTRPQTFSTNSKWLNGPSFLEFSDDQWPPMPDGMTGNEASDIRAKELYTVQNDDENAIPFNRYSNYYRFLKIMCWVRLAIKRFRSYCTKEVLTHLRINVNFMAETEGLICRLVQQTAFRNEIELLKSNLEINKSSNLWGLTPVLDENDILRVGGRLDNASCVPVCTKRPIILPKEHDLTRLIIQHYHELFRHQNQESIVCAVRYKFWVPNLRRLVQSTKRRCQICKNLSAAPQTPLMGQLPTDRVTPYSRPFTYTGVDYFGPVWVAIGRRKEKRWVALFTCLTVRAVHLEIAKDLSADAVVLCLKNFVNRRGIPVRIRSDRGTNFIGANKEQWIDVDRSMEQECQKKNIEWVFNTPLHPSAGGAWERMVQAVKKVLSFTLKEKAPQLETLQSLLIEAENLINSRPLTHIPIDSADADPLTPNHFLLGGPNFIQTPAVTEGVCLKKQWHIVQQLKQTFWKRWVLEYLPTLTRRTKWFRRVEPIKKGDVVVICDDNEGRGSWKRGIVVEVFAAADGQVRSAVVKTAQGSFRRPASKLAVLDVNCDPQTRASNHGGRNVADQ